jgi:hypothetical protein
MSEEVVVGTKTNPLRRRAVEVVIGMLGGLVIACLNGPWLVSLLYTPPSGDTLSCGGPVTNALAYFVKLQLISGIVGGAFIFLGSFLVRRMLRKRREGRMAPSA